MNPTVLSFLPPGNVESSKHWDYWDSFEQPEAFIKMLEFIRHHDRGFQFLVPMS